MWISISLKYSIWVLSMILIPLITADNTVPDIIRKHGYPCEIHSATTEDGYILILHRIPSGKTSENKLGHRNARIGTQRTPIILQHGLLSSSGSWTLDLPHEAPAFIMADAGFDVWMPNVRGNAYSRNHTTLFSNSTEFWNFSWDEMAKYDVITFIDYVLNVTKQEKLYYIGHSMGTTIFFGGMSLHPSYNSKIKAMFALAPVGTVSYIRSPVKYLTYFHGIMMSLLEAGGDYDFFPKDSAAMKVVEVFCSLLSIDETLCENFLFLLVGFDKTEFNKTWVATVEDQISSGTSIYTIDHYAQEYLSGKFQFYDFGGEANLKKYGQKSPPLYRVRKVTCPTYLIWGQNDYLADEKDVHFLIENLSNVKSKSPVPYKLFNHLDFLWAKDARKLVYDPIIAEIKSLEENYFISSPKKI